jgi:hypothetical protein
MRKRRSVFSEKWLILGILLALVPFFQNMSPSSSDDDRVDLRDIAPVRPEGNWDSPLAQLLPTDMHATDLNGVGQNILSHNFDPMLKELELTYLPHGRNLSAGSRAPASVGPAAAEAAGKDSSSWKLGVINPTKLRLMYSNPQIAEGFQLSCETEGTSGLFFKMSHPLSSKMNLGITHETGQRQSQIQVDYRW